MNEVTLTALLSLVGTLAGTFGGIVTGSRLTNFRIEQLEKKVEKHNNLVERTFKIEEHLTVHDEQMRVANHRIDDLEEAAKHD